MVSDYVNKTIYVFPLLLQILSFHSFKAIHSTLSRLHQNNLMPMLIPTSVKVDIGWEAVLRTLRNNITNSSIGNDLQISSKFLMKQKCFFPNRKNAKMTKIWKFNKQVYIKQNQMPRRYLNR